MGASRYVSYELFELNLFLKANINNILDFKVENTVQATATEYDKYDGVFTLKFSKS